VAPGAGAPKLSPSSATLQGSRSGLGHAYAADLLFTLEFIAIICPWQGRKNRSPTTLRRTVNEAADTAGRAASRPSRGVCVATAAKSSLPPD
jgi:hypothetical protein